MVSKTIELYTDGSSLRNPGASGLGYLIRYWDNPDDESMPEEKIIEGSQGFRLSTNNRMEIMAAIYGINAIIAKIDDKTFEGAGQINLASDSEYFVKAITQKWLNKWQQNNWMTSGFNGQQPKAVKNKDLWEQVLEFQNQLKARGITLVVTHVDGHSGHEYNERCDRLAVGASNNAANHIIDEMYEKTAPVLNRQ